jgi:hypothetical protein
MNSIVTLTTDFGTSDYFVGAIKGGVLSVSANAKIVDITHHVPAHDINAAAFTLFAAYQTFPKGTIHVAVVDPGVGSNRRPILAVTDNYFFVAPDNGILSLIYENEQNVRVYHLTNDRFFRFPVSTTFHGRDIFAPIAGALAFGVGPDELGEEIADFVRFEVAKPRRVDEQHIVANILHIDRFGNCLTNLTIDDLPLGFHNGRFKLEINKREITKFQNFYSETSKKGELFLIYGSAGFLEIVAFQDSAEKILKVKNGQEVKLVSL